MTLPNLALGVSLIAAVWFLLGYCWRPASFGKSVVKTVAVAALALSAIMLHAPVPLIAALCLGALGDYFLSLEGDRAFISGLSAFALSHLAYVALFLTLGAAITFDVFTSGIGVFALLMGALLFRNAGNLRWPVAVYVVIIALMGILAVDLPTDFALGTIAAALFIVSDAALGLQLFVLSAGGALKKMAPFFVWTFYWVAQLLFLISFAGPIFA